MRFTSFLWACFFIVLGWAVQDIVDRVTASRHVTIAPTIVDLTFPYPRGWPTTTVQ
jgi:hypothetical protein